MKRLAIIITGLKKDTLNNAELMYEIQKPIIDGFKKKTFFSDYDGSYSYENLIVSNLYSNVN